MGDFADIRRAMLRASAATDQLGVAIRDLPRPLHTCDEAEERAGRQRAAEAFGVPAGSVYSHPCLGKHLYFPGCCAGPFRVAAGRSYQCRTCKRVVVVVRAYRRDAEEEDDD